MWDMSYEALKERVCAANKEINRIQLAILSWGNASEVDRRAGVFAIKPSGVDYGEMTSDDIPIISLETGEKVEGRMNPSSDTATHWHLYRTFGDIGGVVHTHSTYATAWAQANREIPCLGTTHADTFHGSVPCTRALTQAEVESEYELNTGRVIVEHFEKNGLKAAEFPGVLVSSHAPFAWGSSGMKAVVNGRVLEEVARMASITLGLNPGIGAVGQYLMDKHYLRKHGANAYYGQE
jgi:L-ribulose-5-phosphate 4-epimerase